MSYRLFLVITLALAGGAAAHAQLTVVSGASFVAGPVSPDSIATIKGSGLAAAPLAAKPPLPTILGLTTVTVTDSAGHSSDAQLYYVSPTQINFVVPSNAALGAATVTVTSGSAHQSGTMTIAKVAPALFLEPGSSTKPLAAQFERRGASGDLKGNTFSCTPQPVCTESPLDLGTASDQFYLVLYATGVRGRTNLNSVQVSIGGTVVSAAYAGAQPQFPGLDQINVLVPASISRNQIATISVTVENQVSSDSGTVLLGNGVVFPNSALASFDTNSPDVGPFPSDAFATADSAQNTGLRVNLPQANCQAQSSNCQVAGLLNQLDGFSIDPRIAIRFSAPVDLNTVRGGVFFYTMDEAASGDPGQYPAGHLTRINQIVFDPVTNTLYAKPDETLDQHRRYALLVTTGVRDPHGLPVSAGQAYLSCLDSASGYCGKLSQAVKAATAAVAPERIVSASVFTTQSVTTWLEKARQQLSSVSAAYTRATGAIADLTSNPNIVLHEQTAASQFIDLPVPSTLVRNLGRIAFGTFQSPRYVNDQGVIAAGPSGSIQPANGADTIGVHFYLPNPAVSPQPAGGYPVVIFGHGYGDNSIGSPTLVASSLNAKGFAVAAINAFGHGYGPQSAVVINGVQYPAPGRGIVGSGSISSTAGCMVMSPPIALRDCIRQTAVDLSQLVRVLQKGVDLDGNGTIDLDAGKIYYASISFGTLYGTVFTSVEPAVRAAVLNDGGGPVTEIARQGVLSRTDGFRQVAIDFLGAASPSLLNSGQDFKENYPFRDQPAIAEVTPGAIAVQAFFDRLEWLQMAGDPFGFAMHLKPAPLAGVGPKRVLWQYAVGDLTVPNLTTANLIRESQMLDTTIEYQGKAAAAKQPTVGNPHTFLVDITSPATTAVAVAAQMQLADFLASDGVTIIDGNAANASALSAYFPGMNLFDKPFALPNTNSY